MSYPYTFQEHIHRYAVWTAASAVSRDFTGTENVSKAIDEAKLRDFVEGRDTPKNFDNWHREKCRAIIAFLDPIVPKRKESLKKTYKDDGNRVTYGRAAKIIAIYLKTAVVVPEGATGDRSKDIHPPIDRILLQAIADHEKRPELKKVNWTSLNEKDYFDLLETLKQFNDVAWWQLERHWTPTRDTE